MILRSYRPNDRGALYHICLATGDGGADATALYRDPQLLGHRYAAPYAEREPELCFVLEDAEGVCGYVLGAADSAAFYAWFETTWAPPLRARYPRPAGLREDWTPDEHMIATLYETPRMPASLARYPAHLHIDLLTRAQGRGHGRRLMARFLDALRGRGVTGVHLGAGAGNARALGFYRHLGFEELERSSGGVTFGMILEGMGSDDGSPGDGGPGGPAPEGRKGEREA